MQLNKSEKEIIAYYLSLCIIDQEDKNIKQKMEIIISKLQNQNIFGYLENVKK
jgi:hypothetical protein